tara:strand:- start:1857 stop:2390 length:534 start_codon:yes stop_codon:yes gene_type:complete
MSQNTKNLSGKRKRFSQEYVIDLNATKAAIRAGYSPRTAYSQGQRLLKNVEIQKYISELKNEVGEELKISHQDVLKKLHNWVESDITEVLGLSLEEIKALPMEVKNLITEVKHNRKSYMMGDVPVTEDNFHFKFVSKERGQDMINKHLGFYEVDNKQKASSNIVMVQIPDNGRNNSN